MNRYRKHFKPLLTTLTVKCPKCGEDIELDNPIVNGDESDTSKLEGTCDKCGHEVSEDANDSRED